MEIVSFIHSFTAPSSIIPVILQFYSNYYQVEASLFLYIDVNEYLMKFDENTTYLPLTT